MNELPPTIFNLFQDAFWQSGSILILAIAMSYVWSGRAARAHLVLALALAAILVTSLLSITARTTGWGWLSPLPGTGPRPGMTVRESWPLLRQTQNLRLREAASIRPRSFHIGAADTGTWPGMTAWSGLAAHLWFAIPPGNLCRHLFQVGRSSVSSFFPSCLDALLPR